MPQAFRFARGESLDSGIRRVAEEQIHRTRRELVAALRASCGRVASIHKARKGLKRLRALLRLVRDSIGAKAYHRENLRIRDAARGISLVRDLQAQAQLYRRLRQRHGLPESLDTWLRGRLREPARTRGAPAVRAAIRALGALDAFIRNSVNLLPEGTQVQKSLRRVYRAGLRAFARALEDPTAENYHELRKQAKYLRHLLELFEEVWPDEASLLVRDSHLLSDLLGDDHDLAMLHELVSQVRQKRKSPAARSLERVIDCDRLESERRARAIAGRLFSERPREFGRRLERFRAHGANLVPVTRGGIARRGTAARRA